MNNSRTMRAMRKMSRPSLEKTRDFIEAEVEARKTGDYSGLARAFESMTAEEKRELYKVLCAAFGKRGRQVVRRLIAADQEV